MKRYHVSVGLLFASLLACSACNPPPSSNRVVSENKSAVDARAPSASRGALKYFQAIFDGVWKLADESASTPMPKSMSIRDGSISMDGEALRIVRVRLEDASHGSEIQGNEAYAAHVVLSNNSRVHLFRLSRNDTVEELKMSDNVWLLEAAIVRPESGNNDVSVAGNLRRIARTRYERSYEFLEDERQRITKGRSAALTPTFLAAFGGKWQGVAGEQGAQTLSVGSDALIIDGRRMVVQLVIDFVTNLDEDGEAVSSHVGIMQLFDDRRVVLRVSPTRNGRQEAWRLRLQVSENSKPTTTDYTANFERATENIEEDIARINAAGKLMNEYSASAETDIDQDISP